MSQSHGMSTFADTIHPGFIDISSSALLTLQVAIKSISKKKVCHDHDLERIRREIEIMASLNNQHIIQIYEGKASQYAVVNMVIQSATRNVALP